MYIQRVECSCWLLDRYSKTCKSFFTINSWVNSGICSLRNVISYSVGKSAKLCNDTRREEGQIGRGLWRVTCHVAAHGARDTCDTVPGVESEKFKMTQQSDLKSTVSGSIFVA